MITLEQAKELKYRQVIYHTMLRNADGSPRRYRVNGAVKTWKRTPGRVDVPLKWGLYAFDRLTQDNLYQFALTEAEAKQDVKLDADVIMGKGWMLSAMHAVSEIAALGADAKENLLYGFNQSVAADLLDRVEFACDAEDTNDTD